MACKRKMIILAIILGASLLANVLLFRLGATAIRKQAQLENDLLLKAVDVAKQNGVIEQRDRDLDELGRQYIENITNWHALNGRINMLVQRVLAEEQMQAKPVATRIQ